jgi:hypothetical protein
MRKTNNNNNTSGGGIGFLGALTILFIALKLLGYITWSWWWVLAPLWIPVMMVFAGVFLIAVWGKR